MCFGIPCRINKISKNKATVRNGGKVFNVDISLLSKIKRGDWLLVQGDIGIKRISGQEAKELLNLLNPQKESICEGEGGGGR